MTLPSFPFAIAPVSVAPIGPRLWPSVPAQACPVVLDGTHQGSTWEDDQGRFCLLTNLLPDATFATPGEQAHCVFQQIEDTLSHFEMNLSHLVRTWFFVEGLLAWYDEFNRVRSEFYGERGILGRCPASTAVGVSNDAGAALYAHVMAVIPQQQSSVTPLADSPAQGAALNYGSAFSRSARIVSPARSSLYVSGTASIDSEGGTLFANDTVRQAEQTFAVVEALLSSHGFGFSDVTRATGYLPDSAEVDKICSPWHEHLALPLNLVQADICRKELRFELELYAERRTC